MENPNQHPRKNEDKNSSPAKEEFQKDYREDNNRNEVDDNGQKINWNDPEISESDNTQGRNPENRTSNKTDPHDDEISDDEVPQNGTITPLYDQNPNSATIFGSNADRTFGNDQENKTDQNEENQKGTTEEDLASRQAEDNNTSTDKNVEGDNES